MNQPYARNYDVKDLYQVQRHIREMYDRAAKDREDPIKHLQNYRDYILEISGTTPDSHQQLMITEIDFAVSFIRGDLKIEQAISLRKI